ncbi:unnamed protein product, partial [marine sediment metagenome]
GLNSPFAEYLSARACRHYSQRLAEGKVAFPHTRYNAVAYRPHPD